MVPFLPCLLVWHKFLLKTWHVVLGNRKLVKWTLSIWFYVYLADRCVGLMYTLDIGARNFIFLCCLLFCLCCELWISQSTCLQRVHLEVLSSIIQNHLWHFSFSHIHTKHVRTSYWPHLEHTSSLIVPDRYLSVITNICYLYFYNNFLTGSTTFFSLSFEAGIYLAFRSTLCSLPYCSVPQDPELAYALLSTWLHMAKIPGRKPVGRKTL